MRTLPFTINKGDDVIGRFGRHTYQESPDWERCRTYTVEHVQRDLKGNVSVFVVGGIEFSPYQYEGTVDCDHTTHVFSAEDIIFEFVLA